MTAEEVRNLNWVEVENWNTITHSELGRNKQRFIGKEDIDSFVENIFRDIARKLNIPANKLLPILKEENEPFYKVKEKIYSNYSGLGKDSENFKELKSLLRIPDISFFEKEKQTASVFLKDFYKLPDEEKQIVIDELKLKVGKTSREDFQDPIEYFNNLPDIEKFNVMKYLGAFEVKVEIIPK